MLPLAYDFFPLLSYPPITSFLGSFPKCISLGINLETTNCIM